MYIKIKHDKTEGRSPEERANNLFVVADNATVEEVRRKIAFCVGVPAERQVIRTLVHKFKASERLYDFLNLSLANDCVSVMLYDNCAEEEVDSKDQNQDKVAKTLPQEHFVCFLLIYNDKLAALQKQHEENFHSSSQSSDTLVADSDGDTSSSSESDSSGNFEDTCGKCSQSKKLDSILSLAEKSSRKRSKKGKEKSNIPEKLHVVEVLRPTIPHGFKCMENVKDIVDQPDPNPNSTADKEDTSPAHKSPSNIPTEAGNRNNANNSCKPEAVDSVDRSNTPTLDLSEQEFICIRDDISTTSRIKESPPYGKIPPEKREFISVISSEVCCSQVSNIIADGAALMNFFFLKFRKSPLAASLQFDASSAVRTYREKFWIACEGKGTLDWIMEQTKQMPKPFQSQSFPVHMDLNECTVMLPCVCQSGNLLEVFDVLRNQNRHLDTSQWVLLNRRTISDDDVTDEYAKKRVTDICPNELLHLLIDQNTKALLQTVNFKLKYCFWKITFEFSAVL